MQQVHFQCESSCIHQSDHSSEHVGNNVQLARNSMYGLMKEALTFSAYNGITDEAVVRVYLQCTGLDTDFLFNPVSEDTKHMHHFLWSDPVALQAVLDKFADIIQSRKDVVLDSRTTITVIGYEPPVPDQPKLTLVSSAWRQKECAKGNTVEEFVKSSHCVVHIQNSDHSCMARAVVVGFMYATEASKSSKVKSICRPD